MQAALEDTKNDWASRISKLKRAKESAENTDYGIVIKSLINDFFISEYVISKQNKIYQDGVLQKFNLKGLKTSDLIIREVFRRKH